ncbi:hypothetical protein Lal_00004816 [Lupinus albus]|uniref:Putative transcription factor MADS-type1 family n=1 Tax=Lupinus albus TaxID=3870 RepID=A0A6A5LTN1_LUPAL|nr:putative transcription factor MADS-type1 family [Lupinus albus]KAF1865441.1 hypothetical protein Lal_00004816 [Lupinus albus]
MDFAIDMFKQTKKTKGRKKIEIKKLDKNSNKQVTFSKRRAGLFKKGSELCVLCNVDATIIVFSPADKLFCFGQPDVETLVTRYLRRTTELDPKTERNETVSYEEHNKEYEEAIKKLELEKKELANSAKEWKKGNWWNEPINEMSVEELEQYMVAVYELRRKLDERRGEIMMAML